MDRLELHEKLIELIGTKGEKESRVYFQPPPSVSMKYRCIRYSKSGIRQFRANDGNYRLVDEYELTVIDPSPDSQLPGLIMAAFPMCSFNRMYTANNLNHFVLKLYI